MKRNIIRQIYLYAVSIISLFLLVFSAGQIVNIGLKTWVFPKADPNYNQRCDDSGNIYYGGGPAPMATKPIDANGQPVAVKEPTAEEKAAAKKTCEQNLADQRSADRQNQLVSALSMLLVALPVFIFHFRIVQKERNEDKEMKEDEKKA